MVFDYHCVLLSLGWATLRVLWCLITIVCCCLWVGSPLGFVLFDYHCVLWSLTYNCVLWCLITIVCCCLWVGSPLSFVLFDYHCVLCTLTYDCFLWCLIIIVCCGLWLTIVFYSVWLHCILWSLTYHCVLWSLGHLCVWLTIVLWYRWPGRQYDKHGNLAQWWSEEAIKNFKEKAQCVIDQYGNFTVAGIDMNVSVKLVVTNVICDY